MFRQAPGKNFARSLVFAAVVVAVVVVVVYVVLVRAVLVEFRSKLSSTRTASGQMDLK